MATKRKAVKEPANITNPEYTVDRIVARMKEAAAHKGQLAHPASSDLATSAEFRPARQTTGPLSGIDIQPIALQPTFQPRGDGRYHVDDLLKYHDRNFIQNAYRAILKRGPDATGFNAFIESLRSAQLNKIDILARLRYSAEGRAKKVEIEGLLAPAIIRKAYRVPVIGYLLNLAVAIGRLPVMIRSEQQFEAHVLAQQELIAEHLNSIGRTLGAHAREVSQVFHEQFESIKQRDEHVQQQLDLVAHQQQAARDEIEVRLDERMADLATQVQQVVTEFHQHSERLSRDLKREIDRVFQKQQQVSTELVLQGQRLAQLLDEARQRLPEPFDEEQLVTIVGETDHTLDAFYASFDEQFRGTREEIKERLKVYLPLIKQHGIGSGEMPILDVGCGRGEWLELLKEQKLRGVGVDSNRVLVGQCVERGLEVVEEDLISHLTRLNDASLGAVTGFHIVEHLPIDTLVQFLNQTVRVLKPGGAVIFETPNPQNVLVGSCNFYFDPTHRNPLPSQVMRFLLESRGFVRVEVLKLNPSDDTPVEGDSELARRFNQYFYGPMDYAVIGYRSQTMDDGR
jgi:SAM-dependent methyltransferase